LADLKDMDSYKKFVEDNPDAFFCSAMVVLSEGVAVHGMSSREGIEMPSSSDKVDLNFFIPSKSKISSFSMPFGSVTNHGEEIVGQKEISDLDFVVDACDLPGFIKRARNGVPSKVGTDVPSSSGKLDREYSKYIAVLHGGEWNVTCLDGLRISRVKIGAYDGKFEEKGSGSLMEMVRFRGTKPSGGVGS